MWQYATPLPNLRSVFTWQDGWGNVMDLPGTEYFYTLAALSVTFVGFSTVAIVLRQTFGGEMSRLDILITRIFIQLGFIVVAGSMLPPLLALFDWQQGTIWRIASIAEAVPAFLFAVTYPARRYAASGVPTPVIIWMDVSIVFLASIALFCNGFGLGFEPGVGPYAAGLTTILFLAGIGYLQALNTLLAHHRRTGKSNAPH